MDHNAQWTPPAGGCGCGAVRYRVEHKPLFVHCCHCSWCQRETGSAFVINALVEAQGVRLLQGDLERVDTPSASGKGQVIWRCPQCRIAVWSNYAGNGAALHFVRVGTLDDPGRVAPDIHIYTSTRLPWVRLGDDIPAVEAYYRARDHWPADSIDRIKALKQRHDA